ncbi:MAG: Fic family protein [Blastocatellia bacterium]
MADGSVYSYAPVGMTPTEMYRLCQEVNSDEFKSAHLALQASFAHYALTVIHPFADGNGRVARALASVFTYRCCSVPVMVLSESRSEYLATLREAEAGEFRAFVSFVIERTLDAIQLAQVSIQAAEAPSVEEGVQYISVYT